MRTLLLSALLLSACTVEDTAEAPPPEPPTTEVSVATMTGDDRLPDEAEIERDRLSGRWRTADVDTTGRAAAQRANPERAEDIDREARRPGAWRDSLQLPLGGDVAGPSVLKAQVLLDRAGFSPGQIDGRWGDNTEKAISWFQAAADLPRTGIVDEATLGALRERAGRPAELVVARRLTADDVAGPFETLPSDIYEKAELDALGYESLGEKLGERFHAAPALLARLNDGASLDSLAAGDTLRVPAVGPAGPGRGLGAVDRIEVSASGGYLHALGADGRIVAHFPVTVGASYDPSPEGELTITGVARNPSWHYQPKILENVPDDAEEATLPGGPNNAVGAVWMALSKEHYGIHGTSAPGTIGYASSAGCVRLTNWDALRLADAVSPGTPVVFTAADAPGASADSTAAPRGTPRPDSSRSRSTQADA